MYLNIRTCLLVVSVILLLKWIVSYKNKIGSELFIHNDHIERINNCYLDNNSKLLWINNNCTFVRMNAPNKIDFDYEVKKDILNRALKLDSNSCIIDCGAHIGDGAIPLAHALKYLNRSDIMVYAIDPSPTKCKFIKTLAKLNGLRNITVLNYGLSDKVGHYYPQLSLLRRLFNNNTGSTYWTKGRAPNSINFITLDRLIKHGIIKHKIGIIHLDVEGMEKDAIVGGIQTILKHKPYLSIEDHNKDPTEYIRLLKNKYKYVKRVKDNNIFIWI